MDFFLLSDKKIEKELGCRVKTLRLQKNVTQKELADTTLLSLNTIKSLELGKAKLSTIIVVLRELGVLDQLNNFIPESSISPLQLVKMQGKQRQRASGERMQDNAQDEVEW